MRYKTAPGRRIYAIGDLHGRADLFALMLDRIAADNAARGKALTQIVVLGDVVDRGPDSAGLVARLIRYTAASKNFVVLRGNHEMTMEAVLSGQINEFALWLKMGGASTLASFGLHGLETRTDRMAALRRAAKKVVPEHVLRWIRRLPLTHRSGDVLFVHAGIRPGVPLKRQSPEDLAWIRDEFLNCTAPHPCLIVHGHAEDEAGPQVHENRIGVDTGAYRTGRLTALGIEGSDVWFLTATG